MAPHYQILYDRKLQMAPHYHIVDCWYRSFGSDTIIGTIVGGHAYDIYWIFFWILHTSSGYHMFLFKDIG